MADIDNEEGDLAATLLTTSRGEPSFTVKITAQKCGRERPASDDAHGAHDIVISESSPPRLNDRPTNAHHQWQRGCKRHAGGNARWHHRDCFGATMGLRCYRQ